MDTVVVTRHESFVAYLRELGVVGEDAVVLAHVTENDVRGKHVVGVLPLQLAALAASVTVVELSMTPDMRGRELSLEDVRRVAGPVSRFKVTRC